MRITASFRGKRKSDFIIWKKSRWTFIEQQFAAPRALAGKKKCFYREQKKHNEIGLINN